MENTQKLPAEFKAKWIEALRSGKYEQAQNELINNNNKYCCLGVACLVAGYSDNNLRNPNTGSAYPYIPRTFDKIPKLILDGDIYSISHKIGILNDVNGFTFSEIADWIEKKL